jgi:hypothetical protein
MAPSRRRLAAVAAVVVLIAGSVAAWAWHSHSAERPRLGLFTSLPIYWPESGSIGEALDGGDNRHWVRGALEQDYVLVPLDTLDGPETAKLDLLLIAQPRPLAPAENVALDHWVRDGGRVLLFADPFLTEESRFAIGDKRRPQDVVLLSPILQRWGLDLTFDADQPDGERTVVLGDERLPERLSGRFRLVRPGAPAHCSLAARALIADCRVGKGRATAVADAALLDARRSSGEGGAPLSALLDRAFGD